MFGYRHAFHAGNFADVFKHVILIQLLQALRKKEKPFFVLDTHAGAGQYDLRSDEAQKVGEYRFGIGRLWERNDLPLLLREYRDVVSAFNPGTRLLSYPGSPRITREFLRPDDRLVLCELHPTDHALLQTCMRDWRHVSVLGLDGYEALKVHLPPRENRGLVFMDPSFEVGGEFERLFDAVKLIHQRWRNGMLAIWYPILHRAPSQHFHERLQRLGIPSVLCAELGIAPYDSPQGMHGCGMVLVNPPWKLDDNLRECLPVLLGLLRQDAPGTTRVEWLTRE
jgi:23S rRNA (adenine2030-N6)-methyltransferase